MMNLSELIISTVCLRPYVFLFLLAYIIGASLELGITRALCYIPIGYFVAWFSEFSSIHTGFPYGMYRYIQTTVNQELWVFGVPFMDSLSYVFLSYAAYSTTRLAMGKLTKVAHSPHHEGAILNSFDNTSQKTFLFIPPDKRSLKFTTVGSLLLTLLDIIIDPVALRGDRWFLGKIYEYPESGIYFGVPLSNFLGWFIVGLVLIRILQLIAPHVETPIHIKGFRSWMTTITGPVLYGAILCFNIAVTLMIDEKLIFIADLSLLFLAIAFIKATRHICFLKD
ncbi:MAG: carotenoid biosynthesis protein [Deltaproteobacteria bacterium]|nr:carotenoid biosynthesis protein [Deltaproteobacteria bacterium]MBW2067416.1 carotenoid biosynthesis protein [Deltaproteobacteria bacterium]